MGIILNWASQLSSFALQVILARKQQTQSLAAQVGTQSKAT
jgi:hypothetical protein